MKLVSNGDESGCNVGGAGASQCREDVEEELALNIIKDGLERLPLRGTLHVTYRHRVQEDSIVRLLD